MDMSAFWRTVLYLELSAAYMSVHMFENAPKNTL